MIKWNFAFVLLNALTTVSAQEDSQTVDSLINIIETTASPATKAQTLILLSDEFSVLSIDTMPILCYEALRIVEESTLGDQDIEKRNLRMAEADAYNNLGFYHVRKGNLDSALTFLDKAKDISFEIQYLESLQSIGINTSIIYAEKGEYIKSIKIQEQTLSLARHLNQKQNEATILNNIGWVYQVLQKYDKALEYYTASYNIDKDLGNASKTATTLNNIGVAYSGLNQRDSSEVFYIRAFELRKRDNNNRELGNSYSNLAGVAMEKGDSVKAKKLFIKGLKLSRASGFKRQWLNTLNALGKLAIHLNDFELAQACVDESDSLLQFYSTPNSNLGYYQINYQLSAKDKKWKTAYQSLISYKTIRDSLNIIKTGNQLIAKQMELEEKQEKEILKSKHLHALSIAKEEELRHKNNFYFTGGLLLLLIAVVIALFKNVGQKQKISKMNLELSQLRNEKLTFEIGQKNKELTTFSLRLAQNHQFLENVDEIITQVSVASREEVEDSLRQLKNEIKTSKRRENDWTEFQRQFEGIHTSFIDNLTSQYPKLTTSEIRLCTLLKLNLPSKDIASLLGVSMNTIKSSRYRIHKKLELADGEKLADFILRFN